MASSSSNTGKAANRLGNISISKEAHLTRKPTEIGDPAGLTFIAPYGKDNKLLDDHHLYEDFQSPAQRTVSQRTARLLERHEIMKSWTKATMTFLRARPIDSTQTSTTQQQQVQSPEDISNWEWAHMRNESRTYDEFRQTFNYLASERLNQGLGAVVNRLLRRIQRREERSFHDVFYLRPCILRYDGVPETRKSALERCIFFNFPYLSLQAKGPESTDEDDAKETRHTFPDRSLIQTRYRLERTYTRDLQQAVTKIDSKILKKFISQRVDKPIALPKGSDARLFHVPQLWGVAVSGKLLYTCGPTGRDALEGSTLQLSDVPTPGGGPLSMVEICLVIDVYEQTKGKERAQDGTYRIEDGVEKAQESTEKTQVDRVRVQNSKEKVQEHNSKTAQYIAEKPHENDEKAENSIENSADSKWKADDSGKKAQENKGKAQISQNIAQGDKEGGQDVKQKTPDVKKIEKKRKFPIDQCDSWIGLCEKRMEMCERQMQRYPNIDFGQYAIFVDSGTPEEKRITSENWLTILDQFRSSNTNSEVICLKLQKPADASSDQMATIRKVEDLMTELKELKFDEENARSIRVPFFEWPLRIYPRQEYEKESVIRLYFVLYRRVENYADGYTDHKIIGEFKERKDVILTIERVKDIKDMTREEFKESWNRKLEALDKLDDDREPLGRIQADSIRIASARLITAFMPNSVVFEEQPNQSGQLSSFQRLTARNTGLPEELAFQARPIGPQVPHPIRRYRGILMTIIDEMTNAPLEDEDFAYLVRKMADIMRKINDIHMGVCSLRDDSTDEGDEIVTRINLIPIVEAFKSIMHLHFGICAFLFFRQKGAKLGEDFGISKFIDKPATECLTYLDTAWDDLVDDARAMSSKSISRQTVTVESVLILLLERLSEGVFGDGTVDIIDVYDTRVEQLTTELPLKNLRDVAHDAYKVSEELELIADVFKQQSKILDDLETCLKPPTDKASKYQKTQFSHQQDAIEQVKKYTHSRASDCEDLHSRVARLLKKISDDKQTRHDANDRAILVFTATTIIFLPLSFFTGVYGMNLTDMQNRYSSRDFLIIALPSTAGVVIPLLTLAFWFPIVTLYLKCKSWSLKFYQAAEVKWYLHRHSKLTKTDDSEKFP